MMYSAYLACQNTDMTDKDWDDVDKRSRHIARQFFEQHGCQVQDTHGIYCFDLTVTSKTGKKYGVEVKDRTITSDTYGDIFCEMHKELGINRKIANGEVSNVLMINVYADDILAIGSIKDPAIKYSQRYCPVTSQVIGGRKEYVLKDCVHLPQRKKYKIHKTQDGYNFTKIK